jgi:glycosyltransferase involved in cell wall biosynthesis
VIALDLTRLLLRAHSPTPTGIDRVELAYARHLAAGGRTHCFTARNRIGGIGLLPAAETAAFVGALGTLWRGGGSPDDRRRIAALVRRLRFAALFGARALCQAMRSADGPPVYLLVSHQHLDRPRPIEMLKVAAGARFVCLIHDLIPLEYPALTRPGQERRHRRRIAAVAALADAAIVNSAATSQSLRHWLDPDMNLPLAIAPLGIDLPQAGQAAEAPHPYFVCIATIERRKNHRLLLDLWQRFATELGGHAPRLVLIGRRAFGGDEIRQHVKAAGGLVTEHGASADAVMAAVLRGARALLLPSFAEGFGLPVVEALAQGVPVLCSDLPALRESGGGVPDYLDPADGAVWHQAILDYMADSPRRQAQLARLAGWRAPNWAGHFAIVETLLAELR